MSAPESDKPVIGDDAPDLTHSSPGCGENAPALDAAIRRARGPGGRATLTRLFRDDLEAERAARFREPSVGTVAPGQAGCAAGRGIEEPARQPAKLPPGEDSHRAGWGVATPETSPPTVSVGGGGESPTAVSPSGTELQFWLAAAAAVRAALRSVAQQYALPVNSGPVNDHSRMELPGGRTGTALAAALAVLRVDDACADLGGTAERGPAQAFVLSHYVRLAPDRIAGLIGVASDEVTGWLAEARQDVDLFCHLAESAVPARAGSA